MWFIGHFRTEFMQKKGLYRTDLSYQNFKIYDKILMKIKIKFILENF